MRRVVLVLLCVALLATAAIAAGAAAFNLKVQDVTAIACNAPATSSTTTTSVTTTTTALGCQTRLVCPRKNDDPNHPNDDTCDRNNGGGNG